MNHNDKVDWGDRLNEMLGKANKRNSELYHHHETFLVRLCEILKVPYEDTSEEDILKMVAGIKEFQTRMREEYGE